MSIHITESESLKTTFWHKDSKLQNLHRNIQKYVNKRNGCHFPINNMDKDTKNQRSNLTLAVELNQKITNFRAHLEKTGARPERADELLRKVTGKTQSQELTEADQEMLTLVINDTLRGVDIQKQYPAFYQRLTEDAALRDAFLDILEMAQEENAKTTTTPRPTSKTLPFLSDRPEGAALRQFAGRWQANWHQSIAQLNAIFLTHGPEPVYRGDAYLEDPWFVLVRDQIEAAGSQLHVFLEATQEGEQPDELQLAVTVNIQAQPPETSLALFASLEWGTYAETVSIGPQGRAAFPPVPLVKILNEQMTSFVADLLLTLEPASAA